MATVDDHGSNASASPPRPGSEVLRIPTPNPKKKTRSNETRDRWEKGGEGRVYSFEAGRRNARARPFRSPRSARRVGRDLGPFPQEGDHRSAPASLRPSRDGLGAQRFDTSVTNPDRRHPRIARRCCEGRRESDVSDHVHSRRCTTNSAGRRRGTCARSLPHFEVRRASSTTASQPIRSQGKTFGDRGDGASTESFSWNARSSDPISNTTSTATWNKRIPRGTQSRMGKQMARVLVDLSNERKAKAGGWIRLP